MFYSYGIQINETTAKAAAKFNRQDLVKRLIETYQKIEALNKENESHELSVFLDAFLSQIEYINVCSNHTDQFEAKLRTKIDAVQQHPKQFEIKLLFEKARSDIQEEIKDAQKRNRFETENNIAKIKNQAVYTAAIPTLAMIAGGVFALFNPLGLVTVGGALTTLVIAQGIYWAIKYHHLQQLKAKVAASNFESDYAEGYALKPSELPTSPRYPKLMQNVRTTQHNEISTFDKVVEETVEIVGDVASSVYSAASSSLFNIWSAVTSTQNSGQDIGITNYLHEL